MSGKADRTQITAGFLPLMDAAVLIIAKELGLAAEEDIDLTLVRETSWANIRDRMAVGHFEAAHMLAPMPIAAALGLTPMPTRVIVPMALGLGGNAITVSNAIHKKLLSHCFDRNFSPRAAGDALHGIIEERHRENLPPLIFAVVHPHSSHNYDLRYWMAACGIDPERDVEIVVVPPPLMSDALANGRIDGYCVGEPWNTFSHLSSAGCIVTTKSEIWRSSPEKVLGVAGAFAEEHPAAVSRLVRAMVRAAQWCQDPDNASELATVLSQPHYVGVPREALLPALGQRKSRAGIGNGALPDDFFIPFDRAANFPWLSHALWFYTQMVRWGDAEWHPDNAAKAAACYRPDLYRKALSGFGIALPGANSKVEGGLERSLPVGSAPGNLHLGPDGFFDGARFDPENIEDYLRAQGVSL